MLSVTPTRVSVAVRVRPIINEGSLLQVQEKFELPALTRTGDNTLRIELTRPKEPTKTSMFIFDHIFDQESTQLEVYEGAVVDMVDEALMGHNASILAYGQTGSGKTFSVLGEVKINPLENDLLTHNSGMFLRVLSDLLDYKQRRAKNGWHVVVGLSCVEIYNDNLRDLFGGSAEKPPPPLKVSMIGDTVRMPTLTIREMTSIEAVFGEIQLAINRRKSRSTDANAVSSRSHCIFTIEILQQANTAPPPSLSVLEESMKLSEDRTQATVRRTSVASPRAGGPNNNNNNNTNNNNNAQPTSPSTTVVDGLNLPPYEMPFHGAVIRRPNQKEPIYASKIVLADLAGSERISRSNVTGEALVETTSINSSLTALGNVVHSLHAGEYASYRSNMLTTLLKPSFAHPQSRVLLLAQCAPTQLTFDETISTLHFANKIKAMKVSTTMGSEVDRALFELIDTEKSYDSIVADMHIFALDSGATVPLVRRKLSDKMVRKGAGGGGGGDGSARNNGSAASPTGGRSGSVSGLDKQSRGAMARDRLSYLDSIGAMAAAHAERQDLQTQEEKKQAMQKQQEDEDVKRRVSETIQDYIKRVNELQQTIASEMRARLFSAEQAMLMDYALKQNMLKNQESQAWSELMISILGQRKTLLMNSLDMTTASLKGITTQLADAQEHINVVESSANELAMDEEYAMSAWAHCVAKRVFAQTIAISEKKLAYLMYRLGNARMDRWVVKNQQKINKFNSESAAPQKEGVAPEQYRNDAT